MLNKLVTNSLNRGFIVLLINFFYFIYLIYHLFLAKVVISDNFVILTISTWGLIVLFTRQTSRVATIAGIIFLLGIPAFVLNNETILPQNSAIFAFIFLSIGIIHQFIDLVRHQQY